MSKSFYKHKIENVLTVEKIVTVHYSLLPEEYAFAGEQHDFWELLYIDQGAAKVGVNRRDEYTLKKGEAIFHKPYEFHTVGTYGSQPTTIFVITFVCKSQAMSFFESRRAKLPKALSPFIANLINEAKKTFAIKGFDPGLKKLELLPEPQLGGQQLLRLNLEMLLVLLMRQIDKMELKQIFIPKERYFLNITDKVIQYLNANIYGRVSLDDVSGELNYSKSFLCARFKENTGKTIIEYYTQAKIAEAKRLLTEGVMSVTQISEILGFDTPTYFINTFKKLVSQTPKQYALSAKNRG